MADMSLHERLQARHKEENETLVRDLEIQMLEPEVRQSQAGKDITYVNWQYLNRSHKDAQWKSRSTPIFTDEAKALIAQGPYEAGKLYRVTSRKDENDFWRWQKIEGNSLSQQRSSRMETYAHEQQQQAQQAQPAQTVVQRHEPRH